MTSQSLPHQPERAAARRTSTAACLLGALAMGAQVVLFREGLVRAGGDELALGSMLAAWLLAAAAGAGLSARPRARRTGELPAACAVLGLAVIGGIACWRDAGIGALPGERQGALVFLALALLWNGPAGLLQGWLFARLARRRRADAPGLLTWEALGSAAAGWLLACGPVLALLPAGEARDTRHGRYAIVERSGERWLQVNGLDAVLLEGGSLPAFERAALRAALLHCSPEPRVLFAGDAALLPALLEAPVAHVDLLLPDPALEQLLREEAGPALRGALDDPRVTIHAATLRGFWSRPTAGIHDLAWLGDVDLGHAARARESTVEAFELARAHLDPRGCFALRLGAIDGVPGSLGTRSAALIAAGAADAGLAPLALPDGTLLALGPERGLALADLAAAWPDALEQGELRALNLALRGAAPAATSAALRVLLSTNGLDLARLPPFERAPRHTDRVPRAAVLGRLLLEEHARGGAPRLLVQLHAIGAPGFVALAGLGLALLAGLAARGRGERAVEGLTLTSNGFVGAAGLVLILERHQAATGALYADLGWLSGAFLIGFALGARRAARGAAVRRAPAAADAGTLLSCAALFLWAASPAPAWGAALVALLLGASVGAPVALAARARGAGWAWSMDLAGSAPGAWLAAAWLLPGIGWSTSLGALAGLKVVALLARGLRAWRARRGPT